MICSCKVTLAGRLVDDQLYQPERWEDLWGSHGFTNLEPTMGKPCQIMSDMVCLPIFAQTNSRTVRFGEVGTNLPKNCQRVSQVTNSHHFFEVPTFANFGCFIPTNKFAMLLGVAWLVSFSYNIPNEKNASRSTSCCGSKHGKSSGWSSQCEI